MDLRVVKKLSVLRIKLRNSAILVSGDNVVCQVAEAGDCGLAVFAHDAQDVLVGLLCLGVGVDLVDNDCTEVTRALLGYSKKLCAICGEFDALDRCREIPGLQ